MHSPLFNAALALAVSQPVHGYWRMSCSVIQTGRVDPVLGFGAVSQHVHKISGASNINIDSTYDKLQASPCTSCQIQADKSAYWTPQLYYKHGDGSFEEVPNGGMTIYYLGRGSDPKGNQMATPFPRGLKLFSGNNLARSYDGNKMTSGNSQNPPVPLANRVSFACLNYNGPPTAETPGMSTTNCPDGLRAQIHFPSCWDGVNEYKSDQSHATYLSAMDHGVCPQSHPVLIPHLFYEVLYGVGQIKQDGGKFVFANGDETGFGFHGDFINGWDGPTLKEASANCLNNNVANGDVAACAAFQKTNRNDFSTICPERSPIFPCEPVHGKISSLPGCITPSGLNAQVSSGDNTCPGGNHAACASNTTPRAPQQGQGVLSGGTVAAKALGCYSEASSGRALNGKSKADAKAMTGQVCQTFCKGFKYAGVEFGSECYCGDTLGAGAVSSPDRDCDMPCPGDRWQLCGGARRLDVWSLK